MKFIAELSTQPFLFKLIMAIAAVLAVAFASRLATAIISRFLAKHTYAMILLKPCFSPLHWLLPILALQTIWELATRAYPWLPALRHATLLLTIALATWLAVCIIFGIRDLILLRYPTESDDNNLTRRVLTQATVLMRTLSGLVILLGISAALMTFPSVRQIGASLLASAGLAGIVVGFAAKPVLGNMIAGLQIALTQPMKIDDIVIVEGEWGRIEEISSSFVAIKIWDERRLIVPLQWFIEHPFQNWTRNSTQIMGTVFLWVDFSVPLEALRRELEKLCHSATQWDGRVCSLIVTDTSERAMQVRALVSSADSGRNWDLRCLVREHLISFLQREHPHALPRLRAEQIDHGISTSGQTGTFENP